MAFGGPATPPLFSDPSPMQDPRNPFQAAEESDQNELPDEELIELCRSACHESKQSRQDIEDREETWRRNSDAYWSRYSWGDKAEWQAKEPIPIVANYTDRFAAGLRAALVRGPFFDVEDPSDPSGRLAPMVRRAVEGALRICGTNTSGQPIGFPKVFSDCMKAGASKITSAAVTWAEDPGEIGRVCIDPIDGIELFYDPTGRGLYRIREWETDKHLLEELAEEQPEVWDRDAVAKLTQHLNESVRDDKRRQAGHSQGQNLGARTIVTLREYWGRLIDRMGRARDGGQKHLFVVANDLVIVRRPTVNPFRHGMDWIVTQPLISVPFSVWGRTYIELFRSLATTYVDFVNLLLDATQTQTMPAFMAWPHLMQDPSELAGGVYPGAIFQASEDADPRHPILRPLELGSTSPLAYSFATALKGETREAAMQNEIELGQFSRRDDVSATEAASVTQSANEMQNAMASDVEEGWLDPMLIQVWILLVQYIDPDDPRQERLVEEVGRPVAQMIATNREELLERAFRFRARGISRRIERAQRFMRLTQALQIIGSNPVLAQAFLEDYSAKKLIGEVLQDLSLDPDALRKDENEQLTQIVQSFSQGGGGGGLAGLLERMPTPASQPAAPGEAPTQGPTP